MLERSRVPVALLAALLTVVVPAGVSADERTYRDPDDSPSALDVARVHVGHRFELVQHRVSTYDEWGTEALRGGRIVVHFNVDSDPQVERRALVRYRDNGGRPLEARVLNAQGEEVGRPRLARYGEVLELSFTRRVLKRPDRYRSWVVVETVDDRACADGCRDRAPNRGSYEHDLQPLCRNLEATIVGTPGADVIRATENADVIVARAGADTITGINGSDLVCAGSGDDVVSGGRGGVFVWGGRGGDRVEVTGPRPRPCNDVIVGAADCAFPQAQAYGGPGADRLRGGRYHEALVGGGGADRLVGGGYSDRLVGNSGVDGAWGGRGRDSCRAETETSCGY